MQGLLREQIIWLFRDSHRAYTIHQLAKVLGRSYGSVYAEVKTMIKETILYAQQVGPSLLCSLHPQALKKEEVVAALVHRSFQESQKSILHASFMQRKLFMEIMEHPNILLAFRLKKMWYVFFVEEKITSALEESFPSLHLLPYSFHTLFALLKKMKEEQSPVFPKEITVLKGHELFWRTYGWLRHK